MVTFEELEEQMAELEHHITSTVPKAFTKLSEQVSKLAGKKRGVRGGGGIIARNRESRHHGGKRRVDH